MSTTTPNKTQGTALLAHTQVATATMTIGSALDVSGKYSGQVYISMGRTVATALTNEVVFQLEASAKASGNDEWYVLYERPSVSGKTAASSTTVNDATFTAGDTVFTVTSGTGLVAGDHIYVRETGTPANSEWLEILSISVNDITLREACTRSHTNGVNVADLAERITFDIDLASISRIRLVVDAATAASGQTVDVIAWINTFDSVTTV